jgi:hypothetical protein
MAEFVQLRCEEKMPELEYMAKLKLFDKDEIRYILYLTTFGEKIVKLEMALL